MADRRDDIQRIRDAARRERPIDGGQVTHGGANPPNDGGKRPAAPGGSGGGSETGKVQPGKKD